jgi:uncharacterized protein YjbJ (UPF0337 family)
MERRSLHRVFLRGIPVGEMAMDKDRISGSVKDMAGKVEGAAGDLTGDAKTQAAGRAREAAGTGRRISTVKPRK